MMENCPPLTSPDGSSNRNTSERCPRPLYSWDSTQQRQKILHCYQYKRLKHIKTEVKEEAKESCVRSDTLCKEEEIPSEINTDPGHIRTTPRDLKAEEKEVRHVNRKGKAILEIGMDGQYRLENVDIYSTPSSDGEITEDKVVTPNHQPVLLNEDKPFSCSECGKYFTGKHSLTVHQRIHTGEKPFLCSECGRCFSDRSNLCEHKRTHSEVEPFSCSECGRQFHTWRSLAMHQRTHSSKNIFQCSKCGQGFFKKLNLKKHERHVGLKTCQ